MQGDTRTRPISLLLVNEVVELPHLHALDPGVHLHSGEEHGSCIEVVAVAHGYATGWQRKADSAWTCRRFLPISPSGARSWRPEGSRPSDPPGRCRAKAEHHPSPVALLGVRRPHRTRHPSGRPTPQRTYAGISPSVLQQRQRDPRPSDLATESQLRACVHGVAYFRRPSLGCVRDEHRQADQKLGPTTARSRSISRWPAGLPHHGQVSRGHPLRSRRQLAPSSWPRGKSRPAPHGFGAPFRQSATAGCPGRRGHRPHPQAVAAHGHAS